MFSCIQMFIYIFSLMKTFLAYERFWDLKLILICCYGVNWLNVERARIVVMLLHMVKWWWTLRHWLEKHGKEKTEIWILMEHCCRYDQCRETCSSMDNCCIGSTKILHVMKIGTFIENEVLWLKLWKCYGVNTLVSLVRRCSWIG